MTLASNPTCLQPEARTLGVHETAFWLGNRATEFLRCLNPLARYAMRSAQSSRLGRSIGHTSRKLWNLGNK